MMGSEDKGLALISSKKDNKFVRSAKFQVSELIHFNKIRICKN